MSDPTAIALVCLAAVNIAFAASAVVAFWRLVPYAVPVLNAVARLHETDVKRLAIEARRVTAPADPIAARSVPVPGSLSDDLLRDALAVWDRAAERGREIDGMTDPEAREAAAAALAAYAKENDALLRVARPYRVASTNGAPS